MRRRDFVAALGGAAATAVSPGNAGAETPSDKVFRVGFLGLPTADSLPKRTEAFRAGMRDLGYQEGHNVIIEYRWADNKYDRLPALLTELIGLNVDVIVTHGTPGVMAAKQATSTIPIVIAVVGDAVASGLVASLARPGGNVTGLTFLPELNAKRLELLKETVPDLTDVGVLHQFDAREPRDFEAAFAAMTAKRVRALVVFDDAMLIGNG